MFLMPVMFGLMLQLAAAPPEAGAVRDLLGAIQMVESGGRRDAVGDGGKAIGPYQIHYAYWKDSGIRGKWRQCRDPKYAERVMLAYWGRYCSKALAAGDWMTLARVHNGGPRGHLSAATLRYWHKVRARLAQASAKSQVDHTDNG